MSCVGAWARTRARSYATPSPTPSSTLRGAFQIQSSSSRAQSTPPRALHYLSRSLPRVRFNLTLSQTHLSMHLEQRKDMSEPE
eukprot:1366232-Pleurochrysis_carterae.AAC.1